MMGRKKRSRAGSAVLTLILTAACAVTVFAEPLSPQRHVELNEEGSFSQNRMRVMYDAILEAADGNAAYIYTPKGEKAADEPITGVNYLENGVYQIAGTKAEDVNNNALMSAEGKILLPFEYALFAWPASDNRSYTQDRFILAYTATDKTDSKDDALFYSTASLISLGPGQDDVMYKGFVQVYDIQKEKFVDNIKLEKVDKNDTVKTVGSSVLIQNEDKTHTLYDADGKKLCDLGSKCIAIGTSLIEKADSGSGYRILDETGKETFKGEGTVSEFPSTSGYFEVYESGKYKVLDSRGKEVLQYAPELIYEEFHDLYRIKTAGAEKLVDASGNIVAEGKITKLDTGYFTAEKEDGKLSLIGPAGETAADITSVNYAGLFAKDGSLICMNDGSAFLPYDENDKYRYKLIGEGIVFFEPSNGDSPAVYDLFTGKKLLDDGFSSLYQLGDSFVLEYRTGSDTTYKTYTAVVKDGAE